jgi:hypothetical protein
MSKLDRILQLRTISKMKLEQQIGLLSLKIKKEKEKLQLMESYQKNLSQQVQPAKLAQIVRREKEFFDKMMLAYQAQKSHVALLTTKQQEIVLQCAMITQKCDKLEENIEAQALLEKINQLNKMEAAIPTSYRKKAI